MLVHVGLLDAMLGPCSCHVELLLSQDWRDPFKPLPDPKGTRRFWILSGPCWAYMEPMLGHVVVLGAMLGPDSCHVEHMLSQDWRVLFKPLLDPKGTGRFWIPSGPCWAYMEPIMLGLC